MEIFFIVLGAIIVVLITLLIIPVKLRVDYDKELTYTLKYLGFTLLDSEKEDKESKKVFKKVQNTSLPTDKESIKSTYKQKGITGTIKYYGDVLLLILKRLRWIIRFVKIRKFVFDLSIASDNAADTAIEYGEVCCVVYPIISFIQTNTNFKFKTDNINIRPDFDSTDSKLKASVLVKAKLITCLIAIAGLLLDYTKKQRKESEKNERK